MSHCEICDHPDTCLAGRNTCTLCGEFIAPVPVDVANKLLQQYRDAHEVAKAAGDPTYHPIFGKVPTYASVEKDEPEGWRFLRVFLVVGNTEIEQTAVVEVNTEEGWLVRFTREANTNAFIIDPKIGFSTERVDGEIRLEWRPS